jgi:hypothetical protein
MHAGELTREGLGHAGVILFRRLLSVVAYGKQARSLVDLWQEGASWDWSDRIEYLPRSQAANIACWCNQLMPSSGRECLYGAATANWS